ncbi:MAG TPA: hypothetical protein VF884_15040 [Nitrososphaeraceae archaeon]
MQLGKSNNFVALGENSNVPNSKGNKNIGDTIQSPSRETYTYDDYAKVFAYSPLNDAASNKDKQNDGRDNQ